eukprot:jgi/Undpi1/4974/HiC_scaffold_19.g08326.m1
MGAYSGSRQPGPFAGGADPLSPADPFADLLDLSFSRALGQTPGAASSAAREKPAVTNISAHAQLATSDRKPASPVEDGVGWGLDPLSANEGSLAAKKRKAQESRLKRDQFLNQMSSFLEGIESNTADIVPPEPPVERASVEGSTALASRTVNQPRAIPESTMVENVLGQQSLWPNASTDGLHGSSLAAPPYSSRNPLQNSSGAGPGSSLMQEDHYEDPFLASPPPRPTPSKQGDLRGIIGAGMNPHPRGSLFDDYVGPEEGDANGEDGETQREGSVAGSESAGTPPQRVSPSPLPFSAPPEDARGAKPKPRSRRKPKPTRGMDLGEVRRRTSLLSGEAREPPVPVPTSTPSLSSAPRPTDAPAAHRDLEWRRQEALTSSPSGPGEVAHPLHAAAVPPVDPLLFGGGTAGGKFDDRGNYFNEDLLLARAQGSKAKGLGPLEGGSGGSGQGARGGGDNLMDSAGDFFSTARDGAKTLLQDAKAGVGAVGASVGWNNARGENGQQSHERERGRQPRRKQQEDMDGARDFEVTFGEGRLGFTLFREETGRRKGKGVVCRVHTGSMAQTLGVQLGDMVSGVNKRRYGTYDEVMEVLPKLPRPVLICFTREAPGVVEGSPGGLPAAARLAASSPSKDAQGGGNPLEWLAKLNPFDKQRREEEDQLRAKRNSSMDAAPARGSSMPSNEREVPGEVFAQGLRGGVFSWSYYGTSDGIEANTRDTYTEHVMRCQWGRTADSMQSWMVARRYREFDALDLDLRDTYPDRRDALPRLPPKEFFKMAPDVVERRTKGLEVYMTTIIRRFPDILESSHLDRFLTISERLSGMKTATTAKGAGNGSGNGQAVSYKTMGAHGSSAIVFPTSESAVDKIGAGSGSSSLVGTEYILNLMSSEEAYRLSQARHSDPVDVAFAENLIAELEYHLSTISPTAHLLSDAKLYGLVERCQKCWPRIKAAAAAAVSGESSGTPEALLPRLLQCDEGMERAFHRLRGALATRGYIGGAT